MKITRATFDILKNFSTINGSILVKEGNSLATISTSKNILAQAEVSETFENEFGIYDLGEFLRVVGDESFEGAEYEFGEKSMVLTKDRAMCRYYYADTTTIVSPPDKTMNMPDADISFDLSLEDFGAVTNMANVLGKPDLALVSTGDGKIKLSVLDKKEPTTNTFDLEVGNGTNCKFEMYFRTENLKVLRGNYTVTISAEGISHFTNNDIQLEYWIALEPDSKFGDE
jgi:hypothetical protein